MKQALIFIAMLSLAGCGIADNDPVMVKIYEFGELQKEGNTYKIPIVKSFSYLSVNIAARGEPYKWYEPEFFGLIVGGNADTIIIIDTAGIVYPDMQVEVRFIRRGSTQQSAVYPLEYFGGGESNGSISRVNNVVSEKTYTDKMIPIKVVLKIMMIAFGLCLAGSLLILAVGYIYAGNKTECEPYVGDTKIETLLSDVAKLKKEQERILSETKAMTGAMTDMFAELIDKPNGRRPS